MRWRVLSSPRGCATSTWPYSGSGSPATLNALAAFEQGLAEAGYEGAHRRVADLLAARYEKSGGIGFSMPWVIAAWYVFAGDYDRSIEWLEKGFEVHDPGLVYVKKKNYLRSVALRPALPGPVAPDEPAGVGR